MLNLFPTIKDHNDPSKLSSVGCGCYCGDNGAEYAGALLDAVAG